MKKVTFILLLVILVMIFSRTFISVVGGDISNIIRVEARYPDGLHYSTDELAIKVLMDTLNSARYIHLPIPDLLVGNLPIQLYPNDSLELIRISRNLPGVIEIDGRLYLIVGEISSGISEFTTELHVEDNNIGSAGWWRERT